MILELPPTFAVDYPRSAPPLKMNKRKHVGGLLSSLHNRGSGWKNCSTFCFGCWYLEGCVVICSMQADEFRGESSSHA